VFATIFSLLCINSLDFLWISVTSDGEKLTGIDRLFTIVSGTIDFLIGFIYLNIPTLIIAIIANLNPNIIRMKKNH
jgi:hypothetical protein